ncbi:hypothetical protein [Nonomuraea sp. NPDC049480]|uniref:hypothetical protein n=1 Tax=Nonomuraea sp. NPDC049480 TaxID=3364353 RepID=UPI0037959D3D
MGKAIKTTLTVVGAAIVALGMQPSGAMASTHAAGSYNVMFRLLFNSSLWPSNGVSMCLHSTTSAARGYSTCMGGFKTGGDYRLGVPFNHGDKVWIDLNIKNNPDHKRIDAANMRMFEVKGIPTSVKIYGWKSLASCVNGDPHLKIFG